MKDNGTEATCTNDFVDEGQGYSLALTATELTAARIVIYVVDAATKVWLDKAIVIETYGNAAAQHAFDLDAATVDVGNWRGSVPNVLVSGRVDGSVGAMAAAVLTAAAIATDAITAAKIATDAITAAKIATDAIGSDELAATALTAIEDEIWNALQSGHVTADTMGAMATELALIPTTAMRGTDGVDTATMRGTNSAALATVCTEARLAELAAANIPTDLSDMKGAGFVTGDDSLEALRNRGDAAWTTGGGSGLTALASGTAQGGTASTIQLAAAETFADDILNGAVVNLVGGTGIGQSRVITNYTGSSDTADVSPNWITNPSSDTLYEIVQGTANLEAWRLTQAPALVGGRVDSDVAVVQADAINAAAIATDAITAAKIATDAIGATQIAANAIGAAEIADGAIDAATFGAGAINAAAIATDAITSAKIAASAITAPKIGADAITEAKVAAGTIDAAPFAAGAINAAAIATDAIQAVKIQANAITAAKIQTDAITAAKLASDVATEIVASVIALLPTGLVGGRMDSSMGAIDGVVDAADKLQKIMELGIHLGNPTTTGTTTTLRDTSLGADNANTFVGALIKFFNGSLAGEQTEVTAYDGVDQLTFTPAVSVAPAAGHNYLLG